MPSWSFSFPLPIADEGWLEPIVKVFLQALEKVLIKVLAWGSIIKRHHQAMTHPLPVQP